MRGSVIAKLGPERIEPDEIVRPQMSPGAEGIYSPILMRPAGTPERTDCLDTTSKNL
jgi:hypothetical protein